MYDLSIPSEPQIIHAEFLSFQYSLFISLLITDTLLPYSKSSPLYKNKIGSIYIFFCNQQAMSDYIHLSSDIQRISLLHIKPPLLFLHWNRKDMPLSTLQNAADFSQPTSSRHHIVHCIQNQALITHRSIFQSPLLEDQLTA